jgi:hypothetical protein
MVNYSCVDIESEKDEERRQDEELHLCSRGGGSGMRSRIYGGNTGDEYVTVYVVVTWR